MELYMQFGWGMKNLVLDFANEWKSLNVILSPRDITPVQLEKWGKEFSKAGVSCLFDPQCYFPRSNHKRLSQYDYWNNSMSTNLSSNENYETTLIRKIKHYNDLANSSKFIIPAIMRKYDVDWLERWRKDSFKLIEATKNVINNKKILLTLALPSDLMCQSEDIIEKMIDTAGQYEVDGFYIIAEPPNGQYLVENPLWLSNVLQLCAGLKLLQKEVIYGYANQQMLCLSAAKIDAIASGTYLNVRKFSNKFEEIESEIKRKSIWYYYPESLSEYKFSFLDVAYNAKVLDEMKPHGYKNTYINLIFSGVMPSTTTFNETLAFRHYLEALKEQATICTRGSFKETISANEILLETAERRIEYLERNGVYAQARSFKEVVDVNRSAIQRLQKTRGFLLEYSWNNI
ncbi:hypothetical protein IEC97_14715 [Neobacillus cucumis]|uniref:hypothetical protein n=1 Tax=Neobacillus cucumis TaxID=1740721 RepID=UPI0018E03039|nr:hypothetical protein [Neobacillus cucumis]MBI0578616.1 hypothetical protein [Neobacillus cucumis]